MRRAVSPWVVAVSSLVVVLGLTVPVTAAAPPNDGRTGAIEVGPLPFSTTQDTEEATASGPRKCGNNGSVFFRFAPKVTDRVQVDTVGSSYDTILTVFTSADGERNLIGCSDDWIGAAAAVRFTAVAGVKYFLMAGRCCGSGESGGGTLVLNVSEVTADAFDASLTIDGGTTDPATGIATLTGTVVCNKPSVLYLGFQLRQLRSAIFVARAYVDRYVPCAPGASSDVALQVDTDTGVAFGAGQARIFWWYISAYDGYSEELVLAPLDPVQVLTLT